MHTQSRQLAGGPHALARAVEPTRVARNIHPVIATRQIGVKPVESSPLRLLRGAADRPKSQIPDQPAAEDWGIPFTDADDSGDLQSLIAFWKFLPHERREAIMRLAGFVPEARYRSKRIVVTINVLERWP